jgi:hypothetical protein
MYPLFVVGTAIELKKAGAEEIGVGVSRKKSMKAN